MTFDLIVMGSGPAGQRAAIQAAKLGKKVLIIEKEKVGGACLHLGTVPSKTLREAALATASSSTWNFEAVMKRKNRVIELEAEVLTHQISRNNVTYCQGEASFVNPQEVILTDGNSFRAAKIVIAVGTSPSRLPNISFDHKAVRDSDSILSLTQLPRTMAVIGAGVIGCEYASIFAKLGVTVTLIDRRTELLRSIDLEIVDQLGKHFASSGITLKLGSDLGAIGTDGNNGFVEIAKNKNIFDCVLVCMGRSGNSTQLGLEKLGIKADKRGMIEVNDNYQTTVPHIYAVGDVIGPPALAASSSEQGRLAACHAFGHNGGKFPTFFPYGIYTIPEISTVGMLESDATAQNIPFIVGRAKYKELARGQILNDENGLLKLIFHKENRKLLGVHIIGSGATELIHIGQAAMVFNAEVDFFVNNVFNYPTLAEAYKVAAYNAMNQYL